MCMWDNMVECTKGIMLWVRNVFNIWVGLWSSESVCSVCVMLCLGSVHELCKGGFGVCRAMYVYAPGSSWLWIVVSRRVLGAILKSFTGEILTCTWSCTGKQLNVNCGAIYVNGDYNGGWWYTWVEELTWQRSWACVEYIGDYMWCYIRQWRL